MTGSVETEIVDNKNIKKSILMATKYDFTQVTDLHDPLLQEKYINPLPLPTRIDATDGKKLKIDMRESEQWLGLIDENGNPLLTTIWGYTATGQSSVTYPGPTIVAEEGTPLSVEWRNKLPRRGHLLPVDPTYHQAHPALKWLKKGYIPTVTHLLVSWLCLKGWMSLSDCNLC